MGAWGAGGGGGGGGRDRETDNSTAKNLTLNDSSIRSIC